MDDTPKTITEIKAEERRQERAQHRRARFQRLRGIVKFILVVTIFAYAFIHRAEIQKVCYAAFDRAMKHVTLSPQTKQKSADYQKQLDDATTN